MYSIVYHVIDTKSDLQEFSSSTKTFRIEMQPQKKIPNAEKRSREKKNTFKAEN